MNTPNCLTYFFLAVTLTACNPAWIPGVRGPEIQVSEISRENYHHVIITPRLIATLPSEHKVPTKIKLARETSTHPYVYRVAPQDVLSITVWDHPELTIPAGEVRSADAAGYIVQEDGHFYFPYVGQVKASGRTVEAIRDELTQRLASTIIDPQIGVTVSGYRGKKVYIAGEVKKPGVYPITN